MALVVLSWLGELLLDWFPFLSVLSAGVSIHVVIYLALFVIIIYLALQKSYRPEEPVVLSDRVRHHRTSLAHPRTPSLSLSCLALSMLMAAIAGNRKSKSASMSSIPSRCSRP